jgi:glutaredoxin-dependent peroxiredoxin
VLLLRAKNTKDSFFSVMIQLARNPCNLTNLDSSYNPYPRDKMTLDIGTIAPDFTLKTKTPDGLNDITLSEHKGESNVVLLFFPFAFTSVCMAEACSVRDDLKAYDELNAKVYGISVDSPFAQEAMAIKEGLNFPLLSDFNKEVSQKYGVLYEDFIGFQGVSKRSAFVISKEGTVALAWSSDDPKQLPDFAQIKGVL